MGVAQWMPHSMSAATVPTGGTTRRPPRCGSSGTASRPGCARTARLFMCGKNQQHKYVHLVQYLRGKVLFALTYVFVALLYKSGSFIVTRDKVDGSSEQVRVVLVALAVEVLHAVVGLKLTNRRCV